jgi:photosystem II stability/assembly factor-like uncharacterized protein
MRILFLTLILGLCGQVFAQTPTPAAARVGSFQQRKKLEAASLLGGLEFRSIGPSVQSGRVVDLDVREDDPSHFYVAFASGGLWKTENNGTSFKPLFDNEMVMTIGDVAVNWKTNTIWLGTGENNSSRSSYAGVGIYKSSDGGKTWQHLGLDESHHISRIVLHPTDPNVAWVAVLGHLYSNNPERGIYKTTDGGKTWKQTLSVSDKAGAADLMIDPTNPNVLYASMWHRERSAWNFVEAGAASGIYKSTDGGVKWSKVSNAGFPEGEGVGRIGLAICKTGGKTVLYAALDNNGARPAKTPDDPEALTKNQLRNMGKEQFLALKKYQIKDYLQGNGFPEDLTVDKVLDMVKTDKIKPQVLVEYTEDANSLLLNAEVIGLEVYRSDDEGKSWKRTHSDYLDFVYNTYGYYFGQVRVSPTDANKVFVYGVPILRSDDGGKTFKSVDEDNVHSDHHALWVNGRRPGHLILGNDGGVNISYDDGKTWVHCNTPAVGQFYHVMLDNATPYNVYGGLQDNGVWMGPSNYQAGFGWYSRGQYPYKSIMGGDGMQTAVDTRDNATVYTGFQFGNTFRINTRTQDRKFITPKHKFGERPLRWNWQAPIMLSSHNQDIVYFASNKFHRSFNKGDSFEEISGDLTQGGKKGDVPFGTIACIHESPLKFGLLYAGSDDGLIHVTRDGGFTWKKISDGLPQNLWVVRIQASKYAEGRVYAALNGYRYDDFKAYVYVSENYGETWTPIGTDLPLEPVNVVKEDPANENLLYVGTDHGLYVTFDRGKSFQLMNAGLPATPVHDLMVHPRDKELVVATHGRSLYVARMKEAQQLKGEVLSTVIKAFEPDVVRWSPRWGTNFASYLEPSKVECKLPVFVGNAGKVNVSIKSDETVLKTFTADAKKGLNYLVYDLTMNTDLATAMEQKLNKARKEDDKPIMVKTAKDGKLYLPRGDYKVVFSKDGKEVESKLSVK